MNKKVISMLTAGAFALLFTACGDTLVDADNNSPINSTAKLKVFVRDNDTGAPIEGASVTLISTGKTEVSKADGSVSFSDVYLGVSSVLVKDANNKYLSLSSQATISGATPTDNIYIANENVLNVALYPKTAKLEGYLSYKDQINGGNREMPASGAKVVIKYSDPTTVLILDKYDTATVGPDGRYTFNNVAAGVVFSVTALPWQVGNFSFASKSISAPTPLQSTGSTAMLVNTTYGDEASYFTLVSYTSKVKKDDPIVFTFNEDVSEATKKISVNASQPVNFVWEGKTLTITPIDGKWLTRSVTVSPAVGITEITSKSGKPLESVSISSIEVEDFNPDLTGKDVVSLTANGTTTALGITLTWKKFGLNGTECSVSNYNIYVKAPGADERYETVIPTFVVNADQTLCTATIGTSSPINDGVNSIAVQAKDGTVSKSKLTITTVSLTAP